MERFAVYCRDERKKERKKQKTYHYLSMASFSLWILSSLSLEPGIYFQGVKKTKREYINWFIILGLLAT